MATEETKTNENQQPSQSYDEDSDEDTYHIKWIDWFDEKIPLITQNKNGPCPLLAIFNVLLLSKRIVLSSVLEMISSHQILDYIGGLMYENIPSDLSDEDRLNYEQNMADAIAVFPKLQTGVDVNVQFKDVSCFECTSEIIVFDVLQIPLYHGWLPDPQDEATYSVLCKLSYNQIVDKIITSKDSSDSETIREGLIAEQFLKATASQLTCHGVVKILETMGEQQLAVFFRNNHFSTLYKKNNELFTLVTDQGFLSKPNIVWETLSNVQGDTHFTDSSFRTTPFETNEEQLTEAQQIDQDYQVALSLQDPDLDEVKEEAENADHKLALRLQQEYDQQASASINPSSGPPLATPTPSPQPQQRPAPAPHRNNRNEEKMCCLL